MNTMQKSYYESPQVTKYSLMTEGFICASNPIDSGDALQEMEVEKYVW